MEMTTATRRKSFVNYHNSNWFSSSSLPLWSLLVILSLLLSCSTAIAEETRPQQQQQQQQQQPQKREGGEDVSVSGGAKASSTPSSSKQSPVVLTSRNFGKSVADGNVWLIEVYAPWCGHCVSFEPSYQEIAAHFHSQPQLKVKVGKIDGEAERALAARFNVMSYPSFFVLDGLRAYAFEHPRSKFHLIQFAQPPQKQQQSNDEESSDKSNTKHNKYHYTNQDPMPFYTSPLGPMGLAQGTIISAGYAVADLFLWLQESFSLSPLMAGMVLFGSAFVGTFISIVVLAIAMTPKEKVD